jgi:hypothetical protein
VTGDLFTAAQDMRAPVCLYNSPARGVDARIAEFDSWKLTYGEIASYPRSHAWVPTFTGPVTPTPDHCQATVLSALLLTAASTPAAAGRPWPDCDCATASAGRCYRGACRNPACNWESGPVEDENEAAEAAMDHAWPGWRDVPIVPRWPGHGTSKAAKAADAAWQAKAIGLYPADWLDLGGPVRTYRTPPSVRHRGDYATPWGGYDMGVPV